MSLTTADGRTGGLAKWIVDEVGFEGEVRKGHSGPRVKRVQEWLDLHGQGTAIDGVFGPATERALRRFQRDKGLPATGRVDEQTHAWLVKPMMNVLVRRVVPEMEMGPAMFTYAEAHLEAYPREVGGPNAGPWVRLYMRGHEGPAFAWCAGFVSFVMEQAAETLGRPKPIEGSFSCDSLAAQSKERGLFLPEHAAKKKNVEVGSMFLVRRTPTDWIHTGIVAVVEADSFDTIEGNTNDAGDREGIEVCTRCRSYASKDFIMLH